MTCGARRCSWCRRRRRRRALGTPDAPPHMQTQGAAVMAPGGSPTLLSLPDSVLETICSFVLDGPVLSRSTWCTEGCVGGRLKGKAVEAGAPACEPDRAAGLAHGCFWLTLSATPVDCCGAKRAPWHACAPCRSVSHLRQLALTCQRLRAAANSPAVLRTLVASIGRARPPSDDEPASILPALRSLCHFVLHVAAPHVRLLQLELKPQTDMDPAECAEAGMLLGSLLQACSGLEELDLYAKRRLSLPLSSWVGGLTSLRRLVRSTRGLCIVHCERGQHLGWHHTTCPMHSTCIVCRPVQARSPLRSAFPVVWQTLLHTTPARRL